jgi:hypothetical protein
VLVGAVSELREEVEREFVLLQAGWGVAVEGAGAEELKFDAGGTTFGSLVDVAKGKLRASEPVGADFCDDVEARRERHGDISLQRVNFRLL